MQGRVRPQGKTREVDLGRAAVVPCLASECQADPRSGLSDEVMADLRTGLYQRVGTLLELKPAVNKPRAS
jgi:hypothetical protein